MSGHPYNYRLLIAYDGTNYSGWQIQPNGISIQELIQKNIQIILREEVKLIGSGRTDAGVHARGQTAHFKCHTDIALRRFWGSLNGLLPLDIRILHVEQAPLNFHAQRSAIGKIYTYHICTDAAQMPFGRLYSLHVREKLDLVLLKEAAGLFVGKHDFTTFANEAHMGSAARNAVRTIRRIDVVQEEGGFRLEFEADGFLYKMVRNLTGTLLQVAKGKRPIEDIPRLLAAKDRRLAPMAAPAHGLFLDRVLYLECCSLS